MSEETETELEWYNEAVPADARAYVIFREHDPADTTEVWRRVPGGDVNLIYLRGADNELVAIEAWDAAAAAIAAAAIEAAPDVEDTDESKTEHADAQVAEYAQLATERAAIKARLRAITVRAKALEASILDRFQERQIQSITTNGRNVHVRREVWLKRLEGATAEDVYQAFLADHLDEYATRGYNHQSASAYLRELDKAGEPLPEHLAAVVEVNEVFKLAATTTRRS